MIATSQERLTVSDGFSLDDLHEMLDKIGHSVKFIHGWSNDKIDPWDIPFLVDVLSELMDYEPAYSSELPTRLGVSAATLKQFSIGSGKREVRTRTARALAERLQSFLRTLESNEAYLNRTGALEASPQVSVGNAAPGLQEESIQAERWVFVRRTRDVQIKIAAVVQLLDEIILQLVGSNLPEDEQALNRVEKAQLIAVLETTLNILRSPAMEKGLLRKAAEGLRDAAAKSAQKQVQESLGQVMSAAREQLWALLKQILN